MTSLSKLDYVEEHFFSNKILRTFKYLIKFVTVFYLFLSSSSGGLPFLGAHKHPYLFFRLRVILRNFGASLFTFIFFSMSGLTDFYIIYIY